MSGPSPTTPRAGWRVQTFGLDPRSLAAFRIGLGVLLLVDLYGRSKTLAEHYSGSGVFPRELASVYTYDVPFFRLFLLSEDVRVQALLFGVFALLALLFVLGWHTRVVSVLVFAFLCSLVRRNHFVCHTGDTWLKALTFWAMLLPLGTCWSLDARAGRTRTAPDRPHLDLVTLGVVLQIALFYWGAGFLKSCYDVWREGRSVWLFTHVVEYTRPFGAWLGNFPAACRFLTYATLVLEIGAPFLILFPFFQARVRTLLVLALAGFHLTLWATIHIGIFQLVCIVANVLLLPPAAWDALARHLAWLRPPSRTPRVATAVTRAGQRMGEGLAAAALLVVLASNVNTSAKAALGRAYEREYPGPLPMPQAVDEVGRQMSLVQNWNMFTDIGNLFFGWYLVLGLTEEGNVVDVLREEPFTGLAYPEHYARIFPNHNSRRYWRELSMPGREFLQKPMCDWLARRWSAHGHPPLTHLGIFHVARQPLKMDEDLVRVVTTAWEAEHPPLKSAPPELRDLWLARRTRWQSFLDSLPKSVPLTDPTR